MEVFEAFDNVCAALVEFVGGLMVMFPALEPAIAPVQQAIEAIWVV